LDHIFVEIIQGILEKGFGIADHFLTPQEVWNLKADLSELYSAALFRKVGIRSGDMYAVEDSILGDFIYWLREDASSGAQKHYLNKIREFIDYLNRTCYLSINDFEIHYAMYPTGTFYRKHIDRFQGDAQRLLSVICYLNTEWRPGDGGEPKIYSGRDKAVIIEPLAGRLVCFESARLQYEVVLAHRERISVTGWLRHSYLH
jgi:SM-20-related protein